MRFSDPELLDPLVHCFARCNWCKNLVPIKAAEDGSLTLAEQPCPNCGVDLSENQILTSFAENFYHTGAIASANKFISFDLAVIPFMVVSILITFMEFPLWVRILNLLFYHGQLVLCIQWFYRYWYYARFTDDEYLEAAQRMKRVLFLWTAACLVNWIFITVQWSYF